MRRSICLPKFSQLGTHTILSQTVGAAISIGANDLYGVPVIDDLPYSMNSMNDD